MSIQEREILQACLRGNSEAQRALYERYKVDMFRVCLRYTAHRGEAEDFLQEGFIQVFRDLPQFRGEGALGGWIRRVIVHTALRHLRRKKVHLLSLDDPGVTYSANGQEDIHGRMDAERLTRLLQQMPDGYRTVFNLFVVEGYPHEEIADLLGISSNTSKTQLRKARLWLQARLPDSVQKHKEYGT